MLSETFVVRMLSSFDIRQALSPASVFDNDDDDDGDNDGLLILSPRSTICCCSNLLHARQQLTLYLFSATLMNCTSHLRHRRSTSDRICSPSDFGFSGFLAA